MRDRGGNRAPSASFFCCFVIFFAWGL
jgi:hypothetical protein